jgi:hypothetical protein
MAKTGIGARNEIAKKLRAPARAAFSPRITGVAPVEAIYWVHDA